MRPAIRAVVIFAAALGGCASVPEGLVPGGVPIVMRGIPPFCDRQGATSFSASIDSGDDLRLGSPNRILVTARPGAVRQGDEVTVTLNVHDSSSLAFDLYVEGRDSYTFESPLTIEVNTGACRNVEPGSYLIQLAEGGQGTVTLRPRNGNSRILAGEVRSLSLFILASPG